MLKVEQVTKFVEDVASDLPKYGLAKTILQITFSSFASENTPESTAGEHPIATIAFGKNEGGTFMPDSATSPHRRGSGGLLDNIFADPLQCRSWPSFAQAR